MSKHNRYKRIVTPQSEYVPLIEIFNGVVRPSDDDDPYDDFSGGEDELDKYEDALQECGQVQDGGCLMAGTEFCDFECPFRDTDLFADPDEEDAVL